MGGEEDAVAVAESLGADAARVFELGKAFPEAFVQALQEDFNTAKALGLVFEVARAINRFANHKKSRKRGGPVVASALEGFALVGQTLNLLTLRSEAFQEEVKTKRWSSLGLNADEVDALIAERMGARKQKDWARADAIRTELEAKHIAVMDHADGSDWRVRL